MWDALWPRTDQAAVGPGHGNLKAGRIVAGTLSLAVRDIGLEKLDKDWMLFLSKDCM